MSYDWAVAVFAVNEAGTIARCLQSIDDASAGRHVQITVLLNGTTDHSIEVIHAFRPANADVRAFMYPKADKANTINQFIYDLRPEAKTYFFVDAYAKVGLEAMERIADGFALNPGTHMLTGLPANGRSAKTVADATLRGGIVNGNLYAMTPEFLDRLVAHGFRLPLGIYRGDPLLGSMACHDLDAVANAWDNNRVRGIAAALFEGPPRSIFRWRDVKRQFNRKIRQARGRYENAAIKSIINTHGYAGLPEHADDMITGFMAGHKLPARSLREWCFTRLAIRRLRHARKPTSAELTPTLVHTRPAALAARLRF